MTTVCKIAEGKMTARYRIIECEQNTPEWREARRGIPTSSRFADVLAHGGGKMRAKYIRELAAEIITGEAIEGYKNADMERGNKQQPLIEARYAFEKDVNVEHVGFIRSTLMTCGCSPDGFIGLDGLVEFKSMHPAALIEVLEGGISPTVHHPQIQGELWITGRKWCDLVIGWPKMPLFISRIVRDEPYMANLSRELRQFNSDVEDLVARLERMQ